jgi:chromosome segregation ATPase
MSSPSQDNLNRSNQTQAGRQNSAFADFADPVISVPPASLVSNNPPSPPCLDILDMPVDNRQGRTFQDILTSDYHLKIRPNSGTHTTTSTFEELKKIIHDAEEVVIHTKPAQSVKEQELRQKAFEKRSKDLVVMLNELRRIKAQSEEELKAVVVSVDEMTSRLDVLEEVDHNLEGELDSSKQTAKSLRDNIKNIDGKIVSLQSTISDTQNAISNLRVEVEDEKGQLQDLNATAASLQQQIDDTLAQDTAEIQLLSDAAAIVEQSKNAKVEKLRNISDRMQQLHNDKKEFTSRSQSIERRSLEQIGVFNTSIFTQQFTISSFQNSKKQLAESISVKESQAQKLMSKIEEVRAKNSNKSKVKEEKSRELDDVLTQQSKLNSELQALRLKDNYFDESIAAANQEIASLNEQLADIMSKSRERRKAHQAAMAEFDQRLADLNAENSRLDQALVEVSKLEALQQAEKASADALEAELNRLSS